MWLLLIFGYRDAKDLDEWDELEFSNIDFSELVGNFVSNALKELDKTDVDGKQIVVHFYYRQDGLNAQLVHSLRFYK